MQSDALFPVRVASPLPRKRGAHLSSRQVDNAIQYHDDVEPRTHDSGDENEPDGDNLQNGCSD